MGIRLVARRVAWPRRRFLIGARSGGRAAHPELNVLPAQRVHRRLSAPSHRTYRTAPVAALPAGRATGARGGGEPLRLEDEAWLSVRVCVHVIHAFPGVLLVWPGCCPLMR